MPSGQEDALAGSTCTYAGGGLFAINPITVKDGDRESRVFAFDEAAPAVALVEPLARVLDLSTWTETSNEKRPEEHLRDRNGERL